MQPSFCLPKIVSDLKSEIYRILTGASALSSLFQRFWLQAQLFSTGSLLFPIVLYPGLPAFACRGVPSGKRQCGNFPITDFHALIGIFGQQTHKRGVQILPARPIEDIALEFRTVLARDGHISAIIKRFFQRFAQFFLIRKLRYPALQALVLKSRRHFEFVGANSRMGGAFRMPRTRHARVSSSFSGCASICTRGL